MNQRVDKNSLRALEFTCLGAGQAKAWTPPAAMNTPRIRLLRRWIFMRAFRKVNFYFLPMIIWLVALFLLGLLAVIGYFQGVIRVGVSLIGLFFAALLAMPLSPVIKPILNLLGLKNPIWLQILPPLVIFILIMIGFKVLGAFLHRKIETHFKYKTDDKTHFKWERLSHRLGLSLGLVNGTVYFVLLLIPFYVAGYLTTQLASGAEDPAGMRFVNNVRTQIHEAKVDKVVAAYDPAPEEFYVASDILGLIKNNPLLHSRLSHYPVFLSLAERPEFQAIANDIELNEMIQRQAKVSDIVNHPRVQAVITNDSITTEITRLLGSDLKDLHKYLLTGESEKYDEEKILGRWAIDLDATVAQEKVANPRVTPFQLQQLKQTKYAPLRGIMFVATTDKTAFLKQASRDGTPATNLAEGTWEGDGSNYKVTLSGNTLSARVENGKLVLPQGEMTFVFEKEF